MRVYTCVGMRACVHSPALRVGGKGGEIGAGPGWPAEASGASDRKNEVETPFSPWGGDR